MKQLFWSILVSLVAQVSLASPFLTFELKPSHFYKPKYENGREYAFAGELHVTAKIALYLSYLQSKYLFPAEGFADLNYDQLHSYKITESGYGFNIYSAPEASSLFLGMGIISRIADYEFYQNNLNITTQSQTDEPTAAVGYRWAPADYLMLRFALRAQWTQRYSTIATGDSTAYYLRGDSKALIDEKMAQVEGNNSGLQTSLDLGVGIYF